MRKMTREKAMNTSWQFLIAARNAGKNCKNCNYCAKLQYMENCKYFHVT